MTDVIGWHHPSDESNQWDGFNEPGIEHFRGNPVKHLAREVIQNALDASTEEGKVVSVKIKLNKVLTETVPNINELKDNIEYCLLGASKEGPKAEGFFKTAKHELAKREISILEISDFNTLGMRGPSENGTPFYAFMKAKGQSVKDSKTAGGSYGIGKFAPYAVSKLRTVFVSSISKNDSGLTEQLTQGRSILMSHDIGSERKQGVAYWGVKNRCQPIAGIDTNLPSWLVRASNKESSEYKTGTKLSILCFDEPLNWQILLTMSVMENFFGAINDGRLVVNIDDGYRLDSTSIESFFNTDNLSNKLTIAEIEKEDIDRFNNRYNYLKAAKSKLVEETSQTNTLGKCTLKILLGENLPKRVCILRNGMFISENVAGLKSFSDFKEFSAVFTCDSQHGNALLRGMEPPRHDDFEPELLQDDQKLKGKKALKEIAKMVREALARHAKDPVSEITSIDELKDFFGDENESGGGRNNEETDPTGSIVIRAKTIKSRSLISAKAGVEAGLGLDNGDIGGDENSDHLGSKTTDSDNNKLTGAKEIGTKSLVALKNVRAVKQGNSLHKVFFTPSKTGVILLKILQVGADAEYQAKIHETNFGAIKDLGVALEVLSGKRMEIQVRLDQSYSGALKVVAYEI